MFSVQNFCEEGKSPLIIIFKLSVYVVFFYSNIFLFPPSHPNLFLSSWRTEKGRRKGGGLSPVGKVKLPATELCIKPLLWQLKLSPALCPQCSFLLFLHLPLLFPSHCRGNSFIMCYNYYICCCTCSPYLGCGVGWPADGDDRNRPFSEQQPVRVPHLFKNVLGNWNMYKCTYVLNLMLELNVKNTQKHTHQEMVPAFCNSKETCFASSDC